MMNSHDDRIVVLIDMDCFFCQVETRLKPEHKGKPLAVVQYNQWKLGGIIAVNYEAREFGVTRHMRGEEAKEKCPSIILASVPCLRGKADTSRYRSAGREVINVIKKHCTKIERASVDEAYLDITDIVTTRMSENHFQPKTINSRLPNTYVVGYSENGRNDEESRQKGLETWISDITKELNDTQSQKLAIAGMMVEEIRADIYNNTGFRCSAGISQNKILAKLACGLHKPNCQTILPAAAVPSLYSTLPVKKVRSLGGKFGDIIIESLNCNVMGDLLQYSLEYLQKRFDEKTGLWLYNIARGNDYEPVTTRLISKSIGACKKFPGKQAIVTLDVLNHWMGELADEVCERLEQDFEENQRRATSLTISFHYYQNRTTITQSRTCTLNSYNPEKMTKQCVGIITKSTQCPIAFLGISAGKFVPSGGTGSLMNFFKSNKTKHNDTLETQNVEIDKNSCVNNETENDMLILKDEAENNDYEDNDLEVITKPNLISSTNENEISSVKVDKSASTVDRNQANCTNEFNKKALLQTNYANVKQNEPLENQSKNSTDNSPMTQKFNKLFRFCNKSNDNDKKQLKSKATISPTKMENNTVKESFKESFFMNVFKDKKCEENAIISQEIQNSTDMNHKNEMSEIKKPNANNIRHDFDNEQSHLPSEFINRSPQNSIEYNAIENLNGSVKRRREDDKEEYKYSSENIKNDSELNQCRKRFEKDEEMQYEYTGITNIHCTNTPAQQKVEKNVESEYMPQENSMVRLQDIFPDLNDIDLNVVSLLPPDLQKEAKMYIKKQNENIKAEEQTNSKTKKLKNTVTKKKKDGSISNYLIRHSPENHNDKSLKKCVECGQMVSIQRYNEHNDFHIALNLQNSLL